MTKGDMMATRVKDIVRRLTPFELADIRRREDQEGSPYSDRDMLLDHIELCGGVGKPLTQLEFTDDDFDKAEKIAKALGFEQHAYTSTSALWGLFCLPENPRFAKPGQATQGGCIIKTKELGFLFVQDGEDRGLEHDWEDAG